MANKKPLRDCEEKSDINDITLLRVRLARALRLRVDMLNEEVVIYETDDPKNTFENLFKLYE